MSHPSMRRRLALTAVLIGGLVAAAPAVSQTQRLEIRVLSSRPDLVSGGDALVEVRTGAGQTKVTLNGADVTAQLKPVPGALRGVVSGMVVGKNTLAAQKSSGGGKASLVVTNYPAAGPILSGPHLTPYECRTVESGLGAPLDANCSARPKIDYFYKARDNTFKPLADPLGARPADLVTTRTIEGRTVPYIVRVDSGTINRTIYRIAVLDDPKPGRGAYMPSEGWNGRLAVSFGGGAGTQYNQGTNDVRAPLSDLYLSRGFAHMVATELVNQLHGNAVLQGETLMMLKEHFIEDYGVPKWTVGNGGSGGAIQQQLITQMYPGLLDGLQPSASFPDSTLHTADCGLLQNFWKTADGQRWSQAKKTAVEGVTPGTCRAWETSFVPVMRATNAPGCALNDTKLLYDPVRNPKGARCTVTDMRANVYGRDPKTGFGLKPQDNVGIQYGLLGLNAGGITVDEFLELNEKIGGNDIDGNFVAARSVGNLAALRKVYEAGYLYMGQGGLANVPIIHSRSYTDMAGDIHDRHRDLTIRARLQKGNHRSDNQVIWVGPAPVRAAAGAAAAPPAPQANLSALSLDAMTKWLDAIVADPAPLNTDKVVRHKPAEAVDAYWVGGQKIAEVATFTGDTGFNRAYPMHGEPRMQAGAPLTNDILKCRLKRIDMADYKATFTPSQQTRLKAIFPTGVCDWTKPGVGETRLKGTYQRY